MEYPFYDWVVGAVKKKQGLITEKETALIKSLSLNNVVRIPTSVYQMMCDMANTLDIEGAKHKIRNFLLEYLDHTYQDYDLVDFVDLSFDEAKLIHPNLMWGMYVRLTPKSSMPNEKLLSLPIQHLLNEGVKLLSNGDSNV